MKKKHKNTNVYKLAQLLTDLKSRYNLKMNIKIRTIFDK